MFLRVLKKSIPFLVLGPLAGLGAGQAWLEDHGEQTHEKYMRGERIMEEGSHKILRMRQDLWWEKTSGTIDPAREQEITLDMYKRHERQMKRLVLEASEADFPALVFHTEIHTELPTPPYVAKIKDHPNFLEECRGEIQNDSALEVATCALERHEKDVAQSRFIGITLSTGLTFIPIGVLFAGAARRRRAEMKAQVEAKAERDAAQAAIDKYKTDLEALKNLLSPKA